MNKIYALAIVACFAASPSYAQIIYTPDTGSVGGSVKPHASSDEKTVRPGIEVGANLANMAVKTGGESESNSIKLGFGVGILADVRLTKNIYLQPGVFYLANGCITDGGAGVGNITYKIGTVQIPVNVLYKTKDYKSNRIFVGIGPYVAYNVSAKATGGGMTNTLKIGSEKDNDDIKALDFGAGINAGYEFVMGLFIRAHYQMGFANLDPAGDSNNSVKTSAIGVTVGYFLGAKGKK